MKKIGIALISIAGGYILYRIFQSLSNRPAQASVASTPTTVNLTATSATPATPTIVLSNVQTQYVNLDESGETSFTIPSGVIQYSWKILSGTAKVNGTEYQEGIFDEQSYQPGLTYAAIAITAVTGQVIISYKKPIML
ncbi:hypothetical protein [Emticicia sp. 17c]|uniref:hypothetical protein n=1 Tax=Emticicia sp. 17c TaxID=3127704 RepID=UPI00301C7E05